jgi:hypothetical protein
MEFSIKQEQISIVFVGSFNPAIFQPAWFAAQGLIASDDNKNPLGVNLILVHQEITDFSTENFQFQATPIRVSISSANTAFYESLRDLAVGTFRVLRHTPIVKLGINREFHFQMSSEDQWNEVGNRLVPKEVWKQVLEKPGMLNLTVQGQRPDSYKGHIQVQVAPSTRVTPFGIIILVNDHYEIGAQETNQGCTELIDIITVVWKNSLENAEKIAKAVVLGTRV